MTIETLCEHAVVDVHYLERVRDIKSGADRKALTG